MSPEKRWHPCTRTWWRMLTWLTYVVFRSRLLGMYSASMQTNWNYFENTQRCLNHVFLQDQRNNYLGAKKPHAKTIAWSYDMEGHAKQCVEWYCELANQKVEQSYKVSSLCLDDHQFKKEELESVGDLSWNSCTWHELDDLTCCGQSTNWLVQSPNRLKHVTDVQFVWFRTFITLGITDNIVMWVTRHSTVDWHCSKTRTLLVIWRLENKLGDSMLIWK